MALPQRTDTHRIDTRAVRTLLHHLPDDWLVRGLEERDYGVDLQIELFKGDIPTGRIALIQVKGKRDSFGKDEVALSGFPTKTIEYASLFSAPFFVFHTSVADNQTYFVWLQKYADTKLVDTTPDWRSQDSVTLYFPSTNRLDSNTKKIERILTLHALRKDCFTFVGCCEWLDRHIDEVLRGNMSAMQPALNQIDRIRQLDPDFHDNYLTGATDLDLGEMRDSLQALQHHPDSEADVAVVALQTGHLNAAKGVVLDQDEIDAFIVQHGSADAHPY
ncbi:DUF4365 domain-containing protein [Pseudoxanthomonas wuyuanensis]